MKGVALVGLEDSDVDLLTRFRQRDDLKVEAVYHPDSEALIVRLAAIVPVPVVKDLASLLALPIDLWIGGSAALDVMTEVRGRARKAGRSVPVYVPVSRVAEFLANPERFGVEAHEAREPVAVAAGAAEAAISTAAEASTPAAAPTAPAAAPTAPAGAPSTAAAVPAPTDESSIPDLSALSHDDLENRDDSVLSGEESTPVTKKDAVTPESPENRAPEVIEVAAPPTEAPEGRAAGAPEAEAESEFHLGVPSIELFYDPARLGNWLAESACRLAGGTAAVLWRRDSDGQRYTLVAYAPNSDALPTIPFPPAQLEEYVRAGRVQAVAPDHFVAPDATPPPFHFLAVPLPGEALSYGLLGVFRPTSAGDFPRGAITELSARASELGLAVERCFQFARMGQELRGLRFKERLRDLMLDAALPESERWSRLLRFLIDEIPADFAQFYRLSDDGLRLSLVAVASRAEEFEGWVSIPAGRGFLGTALERERLSVYVSEDHADPRALYVLPIRARRADGSVPIGVVVLDNAHERTPDGEEASLLLETTAAIMAPLLSTLTVPARA